MTFWKILRTVFTGAPHIESYEGGARLEAKYPNPEKGTVLAYMVGILFLLALFLVPAVYYAPARGTVKGLGDLLPTAFDGMSYAMLPLLKIVREWEPGTALPDMTGWMYGIFMAIFIAIIGHLAGEIWRMVADRPYLTVTLDDETLSIQRGHLGTPKEIPRDAVDQIHVARRKSGAHEVLVQHQGALTPVAIMGGNERRALALKAKLDAMLAGYHGKDGS